jgi:hypothetical protein
VVLSVAVVLLEELSFRRYSRTRDLLSLLWLGVLENLGYRQVTAFFRLRAFYSKARRRTGWGAMERQGFGSGHARTG